MIDQDLMEAPDTQESVEELRSEQAMIEMGDVIAGNPTTTSSSDDQQEDNRDPSRADKVIFESYGSSSVNTPRTKEDNKKVWGGKMVDSIISCNGSISLFSDECLSVHGLYAAFYSRNGWARTALYLITWLIFGWLFFFLTSPLITDYQKGSVTTTVNFQDATSAGLPLPIITVCPYGSGLRCDCLLWRKLYCRYSTEIVNRTWRERFTGFGCVTDFTRAFDGEKVWIDPQCDLLNSENVTLRDPCGGNMTNAGSIPLKSPVNLTAATLFENVLQRENSTDGPYLTSEEILLYASRRIAHDVFFFQNSNSPLDGGPVGVPESWVNTEYLERSRYQICSHFRPPSDQVLSMAGASNGISVMVTNLRDDVYSLKDAAYATAAVDVHINVIDSSLYEEAELHVPRSAYFPIAAGVVSEIQYTLSEFTRKPGFGPVESRTCKNDIVPRASCIERTNLQRAWKICGCPHLSYLDLGTKSNSESSLYETTATSNVMGCSGTPGSPQYQCVQEFLMGSSAKDVSLSSCPLQCRSQWASIVTEFSTQLSQIQMQYVRETIAYTPTARPNAATAFSGRVVDNSFVREETALIRIGLDSLFRVQYHDNEKVNFAQLMGSIGGNAGLWCGLSFVMMLEAIEFLVVASLFGSGFYQGGRKNVCHRLRQVWRKIRST